MCSYLKGHVIRLSFIYAVFADREHCQQPDHDSPSHLRGHPDIPWRPRVPLHLLFPRTGRLVHWLCINAVIVARTCLWQLLRAVAQYLQQTPQAECPNFLCLVCTLSPTQAVGVGSWCFHMTLLYEMQVGCKSEHVSKSGHKLNSWAFAAWPSACLYSDVVMRVSFLFCLVICSYWMSYLWFTVPAFLSTVCKCLHLFGSIVAALTWEQIQYHCKMNQWILYW